MSSSKPDVDALMVDWLYGELDPAEAARFEDHLARHPEVRAEAEALKRTRAAFQDLGDAEPTDSLSAILMHEAALAVAPKTSLWSRFAALFQPIFLHPAASAMATVVLLGGVAGALYLSGGARLAEPVASSTASAPADRSSLEAARDPSPQPVAPEETAAGYGDEYDFDNNALARDAFSVDLADEERQQAIAGARPAARPQPDSKPEAANILSSKSRPNAKGDAARDDGAASGMLADRLGEAEAEAGARSTSSSTRNERELRAAEKKQADSKAEAWEQTQKQNLQLAAQSKRCQEVGRIANDILDKNSSFYKEEVENSQGAEDCRYYIASETQRRAKSRAKRAAASAKAKQGESVPSKAKAAPLEADRAVEAN